MYFAEYFDHLYFSPAMDFLQHKGYNGESQNPGGYK